MHDLPVLATMAAAYRLLIREFTTIVRLSWATFFIVALVQLLLASRVLSQMASALANGDVAGAAAVARAPTWLTLKMAIDMVGSAVVAVALNELVLFADRKDGQYVHLAFGTREAVFASLGLALIAATVPFAATVISPFGQPASGLAPFFSSVLFAVAIYVAIRLWPILPMIVVERRLDIAGAWRLTRGRFWSLLALAVLGSMPFDLASMMLDSLWPPFDWLMDSITRPTEARPPLADAVFAVRLAQDRLVWRVVLDFVLSIASTAIAATLVSYAYMALAGRPAEAPLRRND